MEVGGVESALCLHGCERAPPSGGGCAVAAFRGSGEPRGAAAGGGGTGRGHMAVAGWGRDRVPWVLSRRHVRGGLVVVLLLPVREMGEVASRVSGEWAPRSSEVDSRE